MLINVLWLTIITSFSDLLMIKHVPSGNSHMEGHVVRNTVFIAVCDVMDGTDSHDHLANSVHYGQVHDSPAKSRDEGTHEFR